MSAFVCDPEHIAALVGTYLTLKHEHTKVPDPLELARVLYRENLRSVDARYGLEGSNNAEALSEFAAFWASHPVTLRQIERWEAAPLSLGQFFKALDCYEYQACESNNWRDTEAFKLCERMRGDVCARVEGYKAAHWRIEQPPPLRLRSV